MSDALDDAQLTKLAFLAQIDITPAQRAQMRKQLLSIIGMVDAITAADTAGVEPLAHPLDATLRLRADAVTEENRRDLFQAIAPEARDGFYLVPRVVE